MRFHVVIGFIKQLHSLSKLKINQIQIQMLFLAEGKLGLQSSQK